MAHVSSSTKAAFAVFIVTFFVTFGMQIVAPNAQISDRYPTPLTPPGWTFSIWGVIFTSQGVMLTLALSKGYADRAGVMPWLIAGWLAESLWQFLFAAETPVSLVLCAPVLIFGAFAFIQAFVSCSSAALDGAKASAFQLTLTIATAINAAWLTVAASLAILVALTANAEMPLVPPSAALAVVVAAIGAAITLRENSEAYSFTLLWAFWGIHMAMADGGIWGDEGKVIGKLALGGSILFAVLGVLVMIGNIVKSIQRAKARPSAPDGESLLQEEGANAPAAS